MSTQPPTFPSIPLQLTQPFQNIRLLEVPDELLDIITNTQQDIYFKSAPSDSSDPTTREDNLHLCTDDRSWLVKQVSTSNSVYVTKPQPPNTRRIDDGDETMTDVNATEQNENAITAFAKLGNILELHCISPSTYLDTARQHLLRLLPTMSSASDIPTDMLSYSIAELYNHIPAPRSAIKQVLAQTCVFEIPQSNSASAFVPSTNLILSTWQKIVEAATLSDTAITISLAADVLLDKFPDVDDIADDGVGAHDIYKAVAKCMFGVDGYFVVLGLITRIAGTDDERDLKEVEVTRWTGNILLRDEHERGLTVEKETFEKMWEDAVPAAWVKYCSVEVLGSACEVSKEEHTEKEVVSWRPFATQDATAGDSAASSGGGKGGAGNAAAASTKDKKRKWHEKFAAKRSTKK